MSLATVRYRGRTVIEALRADDRHAEADHVEDLLADLENDPTQAAAIAAPFIATELHFRPSVTLTVDAEALAEARRIQRELERAAYRDGGFQALSQLPARSLAAAKRHPIPILEVTAGDETLYSTLRQTPDDRRFFWSFLGVAGAAGIVLSLLAGESASGRAERRHIGAT